MPGYESPAAALLKSFWSSAAKQDFCLQMASHKHPVQLDSIRLTNVHKILARGGRQGHPLRREGTSRRRCR